MSSRTSERGFPHTRYAEVSGILAGLTSTAVAIVSVSVSVKAVTWGR